MEDIPEVNSGLLDMHLSAKDEGNPLFITDARPLECQNRGCPSYFLKAPIRQCLSGHLFCFDCHQGHLTCLLCPKKLFPAPAVDGILNVIMDFCPNKLRGCDVTFPFNELSHHLETSCEYEYLFCPFQSCSNQFKLRDDLATHVARFHKDRVDHFSFGAPMHFSFGNQGDTRILLESEAQVVFVVHYVYAFTATIFSLCCINFCGGDQYTYKIIKQRSETNMLAAGDSHDTPVPVPVPVPITTFRRKYHGIETRELLHKWRTGKSRDVLKCRFVIKMGTSPAT